MGGNVAKMIGRALRSPVTFAGLYVVMLLFYAAMYDRFLGDFYQTTAIYESAYYETEGALNSDLTNALSLATMGAPSARGIGPEAGALQHETVSTGDLSVPDPSKIEFKLRYGCGSANSQGYSGLMLTMDGERLGTEITPGGQVTYLFELSQTGDDRACGFDIGTLAGESHEHATAVVIKVGPGTARRVNALLRAKAGFTDLLPGRPARSLYLSAVTITTLGFGDVVPVTTGARLLVGTEALADVIVAGLFLNAVAGGVRRRTDPVATEAPSEPTEDASVLSR
jgi:hypothetical protein